MNRSPTSSRPYKTLLKFGVLTNEPIGEFSCKEGRSPANSSSTFLQDRFNVDLEQLEQFHDGLVSDPGPCPVMQDDSLPPGFEKAKWEAS
jgi:hypothetical protein